MAEIASFIPVKIRERARNSFKLKIAKRFALRMISPAIVLQRRFMLPGRLRKSSSIRIHFGCGEISDPRFLNVDSRIFRHIHYVTNSALMPALQVRSVELIYACHVFEHLSFRAQAKILKRWYELLTPGGQLMLSVPDFDKVVRLYSCGERGFDWMQRVLMGAQDYPGNFHLALFTPDRLRDLLAEAGFSKIREWHSADESNWPRDWSWDESLSLNLKAEKP